MMATMAVSVKIGKHEVSGTPEEIAAILVVLEMKRVGPTHVDEDVLAIEPPTRARRSPARTAKKNAKKSTKKNSKKAVRRGAPTKRWTAALFKKFCSGQVTRVRETIAAGFKAGAGANSAAIAKITGWPMQGVGKRVMKVVTQTAKFSKSWPPPIQFIGDGGDRTLVVDPTCLAAAGGGLT